ncbi:myristoyl transferase [Pandoraea thiooxydans]|uniref:Myristoyl transferase n=1 Tax=Pandoraea thiooxydans TaxID=445709 RepID=A0A0G3EMH3_9BURK|nr:ABC transporter substrate-binding protein [Pandoraea thiooxydans]AKJ67209.1 myristoyl transferase [Pandoraea thiooxydans]APR94191.1 myristoyl transferase [Pandoraea thiooxydans]
MKKIGQYVGVCLLSSLLGLAMAAPVLAQTPDVVIGYENNGADPYMVTQGLGLFQKNIPGHVSLKFFDSGPAAMSALASNSLQFMCGLGIPPYVTGISQGLPFAIVFNQERYTTDAGIVVRPGKGINSVADLKGKTIAIVVGSQASFELATFLDQAHVPMDSVRQLNMSPPEMHVAWSTGSIDAAIVWDPVFDALQGLGGHVLKSDGDLPQDASSYNICIVNTQWAKQNPKIVAAFVRAMDQGVTYTKEHPDKALAIMAKQSGVTLPVAKAELAGYDIYSAQDQLTPKVLGSGAGVATSATTKTLENTAKVLKKIGRITEMPSNFASAVDSSYAAEAVKSK